MTSTGQGAYVTSHVADPRLSGRAVRRIAFDEAAIAARVGGARCKEITAAYPDGDLLVLGLLKGSFIFLSDLVRQIRRPLQVDFLVASSYGDATVSSGSVRSGVRSGNAARGKAHSAGGGHRRLRPDAEPADGSARGAKPAVARDLRSASQAHRRRVEATTTKFVGLRCTHTSSWWGTGWITRRTSATCRT